MLLLTAHGGSFNKRLAHDRRWLHGTVPRAVAGMCDADPGVPSAFGGACALIPAYRGARRSAGSAERPEMKPRGVRVCKGVNSVSGEGRGWRFW